MSVFADSSALLKLHVAEVGAAAVPSCTTVTAFDKQLRTAAAQQGFALLP